MNPIAQELNQIIEKKNPHIMEMLSNMGRNLFFPKGILSQSAEAREKAHKLNATIGIATEHGETMHFSSVMGSICSIQPRESLTYAPSFGIPDLRKVWQDSLFKKNPSLEGKTISLPVVTCGITHAISMFADIWLDPDDVVILPDKMWGNYNMILNVKKGAKISHYDLFSQNLGFNLEAFEEKIKTEAQQHDKLIVLLNFPNNPTGYSVTIEEGNRITEILAGIAETGKNIIAVTDDSYFGLFYENRTLKESLFANLCNRHSRLLAIKLDGATKENFVWGLRVGFITYGCKIEGDPMAVYDALERKTAGSIRGSISNASHLGQTIVLRSMQSENYVKEKEEKFRVLKNRAGRIKEVLSDTRYKEAWDVYPFNSGYFMCIRLKSVDAETLRLHLLEKYGVGLISMGKRDLRIAFSCLEESDILELFNIIFQGVEDLKALNE
ncbi:MAG: aminotransferase class I/II-fold pyridoxal phosphate-dependent enzyme [Deltaproteobacteria bacterium]|nr:aminotransferase class I/II-fold pyridoxal phosphate-dependent enzyme [Deltaproteobacteria bacterium]MBW1956999.1 aminotransferase class I/II-fold pyridoxal phosphate-dependent enzyme [Deltaproteobacteria bacterium]MBW2013554.1 aminotransferase class I/II-fold pyridoxal phosphate-dependent enzyme [Deltaproteobacteria bacterium]MBW2087531.1 aminotransferase class I/II-fold pyridoxal phosphate-dependent enzyme [Deltaproteobacteria bacterium]MBW2319262.1 aminotransferase class I/II-fold pyridox